MAIVATEIESIHGPTNGKRMIFYRCQDSSGAWHNYGPVITVDPSFDADAHKVLVTAKVENRLAEQELQELLDG